MSNVPCGLGLWDNIVKAFRDESVLEFINAFEDYFIQSNVNITHYDFWSILGAIGGNFSTVKDFTGKKKITLKSAKAPQYIINEVKDAILNKKDFRVYWRAGYDYSVSGKTCDDGIYRAWLNEEFKDCGNGHYYMMVSDTQAIHLEDD